jgi:RNA polymerase sigma-70 factor, ECF subfamily
MTSSPRPLPPVDYATLVAAITPSASAAGEGARREACKAIAAQVYRVVAAVLGPSSADTADVSQEAFIRVYHAIPKFELDSGKPHGAAAWVNKVALRVALDRLRVRKKGVEDSDDDVARFAAGGDELDASLDDKRLAAALLERLDEKERAVLVLRYWSEATDEEIAEALGLPLGTVKSRLRVANAKLRGRALVGDAPSSRGEARVKS